MDGVVNPSVSVLRLDAEFGTQRFGLGPSGSVVRDVARCRRLGRRLWGGEPLAEGDGTVGWLGLVIPFLFNIIFLISTRLGGLPETGASVPQPPWCLQSPSGFPMSRYMEWPTADHRIRPASGTCGWD